MKILSSGTMPNLRRSSSRCVKRSWPKSTPSILVIPAAGSTGLKAHQHFLLSCLFCLYRVSLSPSREAGRGSAAIRHAAERAAVLAGCTEGELSQWAGPEEEEDGVCLVTAGTMQTQEHKGPAAGLLRVLPQPYTAAELSGAHSYTRARTEETFDY